jgi:hypothetical protein
MVRNKNKIRKTIFSSSAVYKRRRIMENQKEVVNYVYKMSFVFLSPQADEDENFEVVYVRPNSDDLERLTTAVWRITNRNWRATNLIQRSRK